MFPPSFEPSRLRVAGRWSFPRPPRPCPLPDLPSRISPPVASRLTSMHPTSGPWRRSRLSTSRIRPQCLLSRERSSHGSPLLGFAVSRHRPMRDRSFPLHQRSSRIHSRRRRRAAFGAHTPLRALRVPPSWSLTTSMVFSARKLQVCCTLQPVMGSPAFPEPRSGGRFRAPESTTRSP